MFPLIFLFDKVGSARLKMSDMSWPKFAVMQHKIGTQNRAKIVIVEPKLAVFSKKDMLKKYLYIRSKC